MKAMLSIIRREAERVLNQRASTRLGMVTSYDPKTYTCKVKIQPEGVETGWIPVSTIWVGNGWGIFAPPMPGDQVQLEFQEGSTQNGILCGRIFNDVDKPLEVAAGELWVVHKSGTYLKFKNNGDVLLHTDGKIISDANKWEHTGDVTIDGKLDVSGDITGAAQVADVLGTMQEMRNDYNIHPGHSTGGPPSPQMT